MLLSVLDRKWREHLYEMDYLREGIGLRAYSQRDPLVEYQREGFDMFNAMKEGIREETVGFLFNLEVQVEEEEDGRARGRGRPGAARRDADDQRCLGPVGTTTCTTTTTTHAHAPLIRAKGLQAPQGAAAPDLLRAQRGRRGRGRAATTVTNADDPYAGVEPQRECPCGSGKKYKKCHGCARCGPTGLTHPRRRLDAGLAELEGHAASTGPRRARGARRWRGSAGRGGRGC